MKFMIPLGDMPCAECGKLPEAGEQSAVILYAGSAWKDGMAKITEGAEMYRAKRFCAEHVPKPEDDEWARSAPGEVPQA